MLTKKSKKKVNSKKIASTKALKHKATPKRVIKSAPLKAKIKAPAKLLVMKSADTCKPAENTHKENFSGGWQNSFTEHLSSFRNFLGHARAVFVIALISACAFAALSLIASNAGTEKKELSPLRQKLAQVSTLTVDDENAISLLATGDIMLARYVELKMRNANDYTLPFQNVADVLKSADITFGNLETPLLPGRNVPTNSMTFRADPAGVQGLVSAGFDVISLANNHTMNYQVPGLTSTIQELKKAGIAYVGAGKNMDAAHTPAIFDVRGTKVAFYAYNDPTIPPGFHGEAKYNYPGIAAMDTESVKNDVKNALTQADIVVVSMHAGKEYVTEPTQFQKDFAHAAIDAGASVVIGHHPHSVQPVEYYGNGVILYSLGNFVFDQFFSEGVKTGFLASISLVKGEKPQVEILPIRLDTVQPRILEGEERMNLMNKLGMAGGKTE